MILELLGNKIQILEEVSDWKEAMRKGAQPLLEDGSIEEEYVDAMIQMCRKYNAYIVLADSFALPHATSKNGVNRMGVSLSIVTKPVDFLGKPVQVILTLAIGENESHLLILKEVAEILGDPSVIERLINALSIAEILNIMEQSLNV